MRPPDVTGGGLASAPEGLPDFDDGADDTPKPRGLTDEARAKARVARAARIAEGAKFRRQWCDSALWDELAKKRGIRLPQWHRAPTSRALKRWHGILGNEDFSAVYGCRPSRLIELNPEIPLRAFVGVMLELGGRG